MSKEEDVVSDVAQNAMPSRSTRRFRSGRPHRRSMIRSGRLFLRPRNWNARPIIIWAENNPELRDRYPGQWVAVHQKRILAVGEDFLAVQAEAEAKSGLPRNKIVIAEILDMNASSRKLTIVASRHSRSLKSGEITLRI